MDGRQDGPLGIQSRRSNRLRTQRPSVPQLDAPLSIGQEAAVRVESVRLRRPASRSRRTSGVVELSGSGRCNKVPDRRRCSSSRPRRTRSRSRCRRNRRLPLSCGSPVLHRPSRVRVPRASVPLLPPPPVFFPPPPPPLSPVPPRSCLRRRRSRESPWPVSMQDRPGAASASAPASRARKPRGGRYFVPWIDGDRHRRWTSGNARSPSPRPPRGLPERIQRADRQVPPEVDARDQGHRAGTKSSRPRAYRWSSRLGTSRRPRIP